MSSPTSSETPDRAVPDRVPRVHTPVPTSFTRFLRVFLPWQLIRFAWINVKMLGMIRRAHPHRIDPAHAPRRDG